MRKYDLIKNCSVLKLKISRGSGIEVALFPYHTSKLSRRNLKIFPFHFLRELIFIREKQYLVYILGDSAAQTEQC